MSGSLTIVHNNKNENFMPGRACFDSYSICTTKRRKGSELVQNSLFESSAILKSWRAAGVADYHLIYSGIPLRIFII